jgi:1-acyl-sn-glycerol-3-phosphate acyltransferase
LVIPAILRSIAILFLTLVSSLAAFAAGVLTGSDRLPSGVMRWWGRGFIRIGGWEVRTEGLENLPAGGAILAANHQSLVDIPLFLAALPREVRFLAKRELGRIPVFGTAMAKAGNLFIDREDPKDAVHLVREATDRIDRGQMVVIFPEGTRSRDGRLQPFRRGGFFLALASGAPVVPVTIRGTFELMPKGQWYARRGKVGVTFHDPVPVEGLAEGTMGGLMEAVRGAILSGTEEGRGPA